MSEVENAPTGAEVAPVANADIPQATQAPEPTTEQVEAQEQERPRDDKGRFVPQERVNEITRARREAERRADALERELMAVRQSQPAQHQPQDAPTLEAYNGDFNAWSQAITQYAIHQAETRAEARFRNHEQQRSFQQVAEQFDSRSREYEVANPGFSERMEALGHSVQFNPQVLEAIALSEHGPAVVDHLAQHLDEADRLARLPPHIAALQLGRIEAKVSAPKAKPVTNAPAPAPTLGGGAAAPKDPDKMTVEEWTAWRRSQLSK